MKNKLEIYTEQHGDLQVSEVILHAPFCGLVEILKTFKSRIGKAHLRAEIYVRDLEYQSQRANNFLKSLNK